MGNPQVWVRIVWPAWYGLPLCNGIATGMFRLQMPDHSTEGTTPSRSAWSCTDHGLRCYGWPM